MIGRFVFMLLTAVTGLIAFGAFTNYVTFSGRTDGTIFQQLVVLLELALASLGFIVALGFLAVLSMIDGGQKRIRAAISEVTAKGSEAAMALAALQQHAEAPQRAAQAAQAAALAEEKRSCYSAYRQELQGKAPVARSGE